MFGDKQNNFVGPKSFGCTNIFLRDQHFSGLTTCFCGLVWQHSHSISRLNHGEKFPLDTNTLTDGQKADL
jgi:hypothetical protein